MIVKAKAETCTFCRVCCTDRKFISAATTTTTTKRGGGRELDSRRGRTFSEQTIHLYMRSE